MFNDEKANGYQNNCYFGKSSYLKRTKHDVNNQSIVTPIRTISQSWLILEVM